MVKDGKVRFEAREDEVKPGEGSNEDVVDSNHEGEMIEALKIGAHFAMRREIRERESLPINRPMPHLIGSSRFMVRCISIIMT